MEWVIIVVVILVVLAALLKMIVVKGHKYSHYRQRGPLCSPAERSFLGILDQAVPKGIRVFAKVRVADIISPAKGLDRKSWQTAFFKISSKHFDYVLCSEDNLRVVAVIELDDKSHNKKSVVKRDELINQVCESAGLILVRFKAKSGYQIQTVRNQIKHALDA